MVWKSKGCAVWTLMAAAAALLAVTGCGGGRGSRMMVPEVAEWRASAGTWAEGEGPERAVDGDERTVWRSGAEGAQWLEVDLGRVAMICGFSLLWGEPGAAAFEVKTSVDGTGWASVFERTEGDGVWDARCVKPVMARFVRVETAAGTGEGTGVAVRELEVLGLNRQPLISADGTQLADSTALLDGDAATSWKGRERAELTLDLRRVRKVGSVRVDWGTTGGVSNVTVSVSTNGVDWSGLGEGGGGEGGFDVVMGRGTREARFVRLELEGGRGAKGEFEVAEISFRGAERVALPWRKWTMAAEKASEGVYPGVLRNRQVYWTVAGTAGREGRLGLLNEEGAWAPEAEGPGFWPLLWTGEGMRVPGGAERVEYELGGDGAPMPEMRCEWGAGLRLKIRAMACREEGEWGVKGGTGVLYELENTGLMTQTGRLCLVARPLSVPPPWAGGGLAPMFRVWGARGAGGTAELWANGKTVASALAEDGEVWFGAAAFQDGDAVEWLLRGEWPEEKDVRDGEGLASAVWGMDFELAEGEKKRLVMWGGRAKNGGRTVRGKNAGAETVAAFQRDWLEAEWFWRGRTDGYAPKIDRPDAMVCMRAQMGWLLGARAEGLGMGAGGGGSTVAPQGGGDRLKDVQAAVAALFRAGRAAEARRWIERTAAATAEDGRVPAGWEPDGTPEVRHPREERGGVVGAFAFMVLEDYRFTGDMAFLQRMYPVLRRSLVWLQGAMPGAPKKTDAGAWEAVPVSGRSYADGYWALLAWKEGRMAASLLGLEEDAVWMDGQYRVLKDAVRVSLRNKMDEMLEGWVPTSEKDSSLDAAAVALLFWPCRETDLVEAHELQSSLDAFYDWFLSRREGRWTGSGRVETGLKLLTPLAEMGRGDYAREVLYALLERRIPEGWHTWADHLAALPRQPGVAGWMPAAGPAADYLTAVRGLAIREAGGRLELFCGAPWEWLQYGEGFRVFGAPTQFGPLDLHGFWQEDHFMVEIGGAANPPEGFRVWWPLQGMPERVEGNGTALEGADSTGCTLPHDFRGTMEAVFPFHAPWPRDP